MAERLRTWLSSRTPLERGVISCWALALVVIVVRLWLLQPGARTLFPIYHEAGRHWIKGVDLYPQDIKGSGYALYRYSPTVAVGFAPWGLLREKVADSLWRLLNAAVLLGGTFWMARSVTLRPLTRSQATLLLILMFPPAVGHLSNGQSNALVIGLILCSFAAVEARRWNLAAAGLAAATLFKLYPLAPALLLVVLHPRRLGPRFLLALGVGVALPFAGQAPQYVLHQYQLWIHYTLHEDRSAWDLGSTTVDLQLFLRVWLTPISLKAYRLVEMGAGLTFAVLCAAAVRAGRPERRTLTLALGLGCVWMTVFGPATESPTYLLLAPSVVLGLLSAWSTRGGLVRTLMTLSYGLFVSLQLMGWSGQLFNGYRVLGPQPLAALLFLAGLLLQERKVATTCNQHQTAPLRAA